MKILHICETIKGGVATYLNTFDVLCGGETDNIYLVPQHHADQLKVEGRIETFPATGRGAGTVAALCRSALRTARTEKPDILFFQSSFSLIAMAWLRLHRVPGKYVYCPHGWALIRYTEQPLKRRIAAAIEGRLVGLSDLVIDVSKNSRALTKMHRYRGNHVVVENALSDLDHEPSQTPYRQVAGDKINLLYVGRFDRAKGLDLLLDAFRLAVQRNPALQLHVVGASAIEVGGVPPATAPHIEFHSWVPLQEVAAFHRFADLVVIPSRWEGLPMALIEALRAGTPVMVSQRSGLPELIEPKRSGYAVKLTVEHFAENLASLDRAELARMRPAARQLYEQRYGAARFRTETMAALRGALG